MNDKAKRAADRKRRLEANPPPKDLQGDLTRPNLGRFLECKDIDQPTDLPATPNWWTPPKHGMEVKRGKTK